VDIQSGQARKIPFDYDGYFKNMDWSPDGERIAFDYISENAQKAIKDSEILNGNIYIISVEGGEPVRITKATEDGLSFYLPRWSLDGKRIACSSYDGRIWIVSSEGGEPQPITDKKEGFVRGISWSQDGEKIFFAKVEKQKTHIYSVSSQGGEIRNMNIEGEDMDYSPDGKKIVYTKILKQINQFWLLENFLPEKKKD